MVAVAALVGPDDAGLDPAPTEARPGVRRRVEVGNDMTGDAVRPVFRHVRVAVLVPQETFKATAPVAPTVVPTGVHVETSDAVPGATTLVRPVVEGTGVVTVGLAVASPPQGVDEAGEVAPKTDMVAATVASGGP